MLTWSAVLVVVVLAVLGVAIWLWARQNMDRRTAAAVESEQGWVAEKRVESRFESPSEDEALDLVKRALKLRNPGGVAGYFHPGSASPEQVIGFLERMEETDGALEGVAWLSSMDANGLLIDGVLVKTLKDGQLKSRLALLTPDEKGEWKIDFDAFARTVEPSWSELLENGSAGGVVRVVVAKDTYFNGPFSDDSQWNCYRMMSPDTEAVLLGYCRKDSPQARAMDRIASNADVLADGLKRGARPQRASLKLRRVDGGESRQFEISRVLAEDWVISGEPFDGKFE